MTAERGILETISWVAESSEEVRIDLLALHRFCHQLAQQEISIPVWERQRHFFNGGERTLAYLLVLDSLNFCFWGEPKWQIEYQGQWLSGYWALAACLKRAMEEGIPLTSARYLAEISAAELQHIFRGRGEIPLFKQRLEILHEVGKVLGERFAGSVPCLVESAAKSAVKLVQLLVQEFPSFRDEAFYQGHRVRFYKRAQILVADLYGAFQGEGWGEFTELESLTAFADYKLPQVLRHLGILRYSPGLAARIDRGDLLPAGGREEVEIRANTLWAVELMRQELHRQGVKLRALEIDWLLWHQGQTEEFRRESKPHHRTLTIYY